VARLPCRRQGRCMFGPATRPGRLRKLGPNDRRKSFGDVGAGPALRLAPAVGSPPLHAVRGGNHDGSQRGIDRRAPRLASDVPQNRTSMDSCARRCAGPDPSRTRGAGQLNGQRPRTVFAFPSRRKQSAAPVRSETPPRELRALPRRNRGENADLSRWVRRELRPAPRRSGFSERNQHTRKLASGNLATARRTPMP
jgi:hypothetical protein